MYFQLFFNPGRQVFPTFRVLAVSFGLFLTTVNVNGQSACTGPLTIRRDATIAGMSLLWTGLNFAVERNISVQDYHTWKIRAIDRNSPLRLDKRLARAADVTAGATAALAAAWLLMQKSPQRWHQAGILAQNAWITWNLTQSSKMLFRRARPYTYAGGFSFNSRDDAYSFISGHSSIPASVATGMWLMSRRNCNISGGRALVIGAGCLSIGTAVLRVAGGKHFTTDVLAGLLTGVGVAYVNHLIHKP